MVGGRLRCIGSNQHLKARFGSGYKLEIRLEVPSPATLKEAIAVWRLPECLDSLHAVQLCEQFGKPTRAHAFRQACQQHSSISAVIMRDGYIPSALFAEWWLLEDRAESLDVFLRQHFPGTVHLERHDRTFRFRLPAVASLAEIFRLFEASKADLALEDYGVSQTSLEQIFNGFAAQQEELGPGTLQHLSFAAPPDVSGIELPLPSTAMSNGSSGS
eukprot:gnl/TRDRNA2_/TRDRNA2_151237_c1_seq2.p1 gnl/TRDRNA2_/TRDRNA2_151237_c1~~gnl/TRDRNA2_/TRDRNA2_151237_c1_seq2.p1  ORF type:complete len:236 (-),score=42.44 gnl/TRDRNA2_/TRDRNA2_151237_c1_seq2:85-732(-)